MHMLQIDNSKIENFNKLTGYQIELFNQLKPILIQIDNSLISEESNIKVFNNAGEWILEISIIPNVPKELKSYSLLNIFASKSQFILALAGGEYLECHHDAEYEISRDIESIMNYIKKYLNGITILEYYNKRNKILKREYFWGDEVDEKNKIATSIHGLILFNKNLNKKIININFIK